MNNSKHFRKAFTLVEALVVILVVGLSVGMFLPAIQAARETARRSVCANHLRQIGIALHNYEGSSRCLPSGYLSEVTADGAETGPGWGWGALLMNHLEEGAHRGLLHLEHPLESPLNSAFRTKAVSVYLCPADSVEPAWPAFAAYGDFGPSPQSKICDVASANYVAMFGNGETGAAGRGLFFRNSHVGVREITDGVSHTIAVGERSHSLAHATWVGAITGALLAPAASEFPAESESDGASEIEFTLEPAAAMVLGRTGEGKSPGNARSGMDMFLSHHSGGVHFVFADGHVTFLTIELDPQVFEALSTRAGAETRAGHF